MYTETCPQCGIQFGMTEGFEKARRRDGKDFCCPSGHGMSYGNAAIPKLKRRIEQLTTDYNYIKRNRDAWREDAERLGRRLSATKGVVTKLKKKLDKAKQ